MIEKQFGFRGTNYKKSCVLTDISVKIENIKGGNL